MASERRMLSEMVDEAEEALARVTADRDNLKRQLAATEAGWDACERERYLLHSELNSALDATLGVFSAQDRHGGPYPHYSELHDAIANLRAVMDRIAERNEPMSKLGRTREFEK